MLRGLNSRSPLHMVLKGHSFVDAALSVIIAESLPVARSFEVAALSFPLKVDLAVALGLIPAEERGGYVRLNRLRNRFAHNPTTRLSKRDAVDFYNSLSPHQQEAIRAWLSEHRISLFRRCVNLLDCQLRRRIGHIRDGKVEAEALRKIAERRFPPGSPVPHLPEVDSRVQEERAKRQAAGEP